MRTITLTTYYTKKRSNSKKWEFSDNQWDYDTTKTIGKLELDKKTLVVTTRFYNVPETVSLKELSDLWQCVIVSTRFAMPIYEHDYNDIIDQGRQGGINYTICKNLELISSLKDHPYLFIHPIKVK